MRPVLSPGGLMLLACAGLNLGMVSLSLFPALIPVFREAWDLSNTAAGWISGVYFAGMLGAVALFTALTDRFDAKQVFLAGLAISLVSSLGFALSAEGAWSAGFWRLCQGIGLGGVYMPGLKLLTDVLPETHRSRATSFYTASYYIMAGLSFIFALELEAALGWRWTFGLAALGPLLALAATVWLMPAAAHNAAGPRPRLFDYRVILGNRQALGFSLLDSLHNLEVMAFNAWLVPFLVFSLGLQPAGTLGLGWNLGILAALITMISLPASIAGNEVAQRRGRRPVIFSVMLISAAGGLLLGALPHQAFWLVALLAFAYSALIAADSTTITAGVILAAEPRTKGTTMSFYAIVGNVGAVVGPVIFGVALDLGGGEAEAQAWLAAFAAVAACVLLGPLLVLRKFGIGEAER